MATKNKMAIACASGGFKAIFVQGVLSAFEEADLKADAYAAASASVFATAWAAIGKARESGINYWLEGWKIYQQTKSMSQVSLAGISFFMANSDQSFWSSSKSKFYIAVSAVTNPEAAEHTQGKRANRLGKRLLISAAKGDCSWVNQNLRLDLFGDDNLILNRDNFAEVIYASTRMLHSYDLPAWIDNQPYIDASYTCICPAIEMVEQGYQRVIARQRVVGVPPIVATVEGAIATEPGKLYRDLFQRKIIPSQYQQVPIYQIKPDLNLKELGVDVFQATPEGIAVVYQHGLDKGREFLTRSKQLMEELNRETK